MSATPQRGTVAPELVREYGTLGLWWVAVDVAPRARADGRERLHRLSDDYRPREAMTPGGRPVAHDAARAFARQVGLDPDALDPADLARPDLDRAATLLRPDAAAREAAVAGRLVSSGAVADALLAVAVTSGVTLTAVDAAGVDGPPGLRTTRPGEGVGRRARVLAPGTIAVADHRRVLAPLFAAPPRDLDPRRARRVLLWAVEVPDAPPHETEEAVWHAGRFLTGT